MQCYAELCYDWTSVCVFSMTLFCLCTESSSYWRGSHEWDKLEMAVTTMNSCYIERVATVWGFRGVSWIITQDVVYNKAQCFGPADTTTVLWKNLPIICWNMGSFSITYALLFWMIWIFCFCSYETCLSLKPLYGGIFCIMSTLPKITSGYQLVRILGCNLRADPLGFLSLTSSPIPSCVLKLCCSFQACFQSNIATTPPSQKSNCSPTECPLRLSAAVVALHWALPGASRWKQHVQRCSQHEGLPVADTPSVFRLDVKEWPCKMGDLYIYMQSNVYTFCWVIWFVQMVI